MASKIEIFFCYAREDEDLLNELERYLSPFRRQGIIDVWHSGKIIPGTERTGDINNHLNSARIILMLVSPYFIDSDYCYGIEMKRAMERHERGEAHVIPVLLRPIHWQDTPFGKLQPLPRDERPVTIWPSREEAFNHVALGIHNIILQLPNQQVKPQDTTDPYKNGPSRRQPPDGAMLEEGYRLRDAKKYQEALAAFEEALKLDPYNAVIYSHKGYILGELKRYTEAVTAYEQALWLDKKDVFAWINKGRALNELKQYDEGLAACEQALLLEPKNVSAYNNKSWALLGLKRYKYVLAACEQALLLEPKSDIAYNNKGAALEGLGRKEEACVAYQQALRFNSNNKVAYDNFKRLCG